MCLQIAEKIVDQAKESRHTKEHVKNLEDFIGTICHEIRNPLSGIYGAVEALGDKIDDLDNIFKDCLDKLDQHTIFKIQELLIKLKKTATAIQKCASHQKMIVDDVYAVAIWLFLWKIYDIFLATHRLWSFERAIHSRHIEMIITIIYIRQI